MTPKKYHGLVSMSNISLVRYLHVLLTWLSSIATKNQKLDSSHPWFKNLYASEKGNTMLSTHHFRLLILRLFRHPHVT